MIKLDTTTLKDLVSKAIKGAGLDKSITRTTMLEIQQKDKRLRLMTTDMNNTLYVFTDVTDKTEFYAVVYVEQFANLIQKLTSETVTLDVQDAVLTVKANGTYKIELPLDDDGEAVQFNKTMLDITDPTQTTEISLVTVKSILETCKASLSVDNDKNNEACYRNYYISDKAVTTNGSTVCCLSTPIFDTPVLLAPATLELLNVFTDETIETLTDASHVLFKTRNLVLYTHVQNEIEKYAIDAVNAFVNESFEYSCDVAKSALLPLLERIELFVGEYDNDAVTLTFTDTGIDVSSIKSSGVESIEYVKAINVKPYTCKINVVLLIAQIKANKSDVLHLQFGNDRSIKFVDDKMTQVIALMVDNRR